MSGTFDGTSVEGDTYTFPTGAQDWAGFANNNAAIYPIDFSNGGTLTFKASIPVDGMPVSLKFIFEDQPYPNVGNTITLDEIVVSNTTEQTFTVTIPANTDFTYSSFIMYIVERDTPVIVKDILITAN